MLDLFQKIGAAQANNKGENFRAGKGRVVIEEIIADKMNEGNTVVVKCKVLSSSNKGDRARKHPKEDVPSGDLIEPNAVGSHPSWPQLIDKHKSAAGNVKTFVLQLLGFNEKDVTSQQFAETMAELSDKSDNKTRQRQPGRGFVIDYETYDQKVKSGATAGEWRTYVRWIHVGKDAGNSKEEIATRRAELDKESPLK